MAEEAEKPKKKVKPALGGILQQFAPLVFVALVGLAFAVGVLWQKVSELEKGQGIRKTQPVV